MFYISRKVSHNTYGVVDTDDSVEDIMNKKELQRAVAHSMFKIEGVETEYDSKSGFWRIKSIEPLECGIHSTAKTAKLAALHGIDMKLVGDRIISLSWDRYVYDKDFVLVLSDYATSCSDGIIYTSTLGKSAEPLLIKLDDNIQFTKSTFNHWSVMSVKFDLRSITKVKLANNLYRSYRGANQLGWRTLRDRVIDIPERLDFWVAETVLQYGAMWPDGHESIRNVLDFPDATQELIYKKHRDEFKSFAKGSFAVHSGMTDYDDIKVYASWIWKRRSSFKLYDYDKLRELCLKPLFRLLQFQFSCNGGVARRFQNYIRYFDVPKDLQDVFVETVLKANESILVYAKGQGWV